MSSPSSQPGPDGSELQIPQAHSQCWGHSDGREASRGGLHPGIPTETLSGRGIPASWWQNLGLDLDAVAGARLTQTSREQMWGGVARRGQAEDGPGHRLLWVGGDRTRRRRGSDSPLSVPPGVGPKAVPRRRVRVEGWGSCWAVHSAPPPGLGRKELGAQGSCSLASCPHGDGAWRARGLRPHPPSGISHGHRACGLTASIRYPKLMRYGCGRSRQQQPNVLTRWLWSLQLCARTCLSERTERSGCSEARPLPPSKTHLRWHGGRDHIASGSLGGSLGFPWERLLGLVSIAEQPPAWFPQQRPCVLLACKVDGLRLVHTFTDTCYFVFG